MFDFENKRGNIVLVVRGNPKIRFYSSMAERTPLKRLVAGSSPAGSTHDLGNNKGERVVTLTAKEEAVCKELVESGHAGLSDSMREHYVGQHEIFDELKHVDVNTLYGPAVSETLRGAMRKAIADDDHALVASLHSLCLALGRTA